jgi:hypothetical protein
MEANYLKEIEDLKEKIKKLENYIKVKDYEYYNQVKKYMSEIDYYSLDYLKKNLAVREQLEFDYRMMVRARIKNDFLEFCRYADCQIELMVDLLIKSKKYKGEMVDLLIKSKKYKGEDDNSKPNHTEKLEYCLKLIQYNDIENIRETFHKIRDLRNIVSHRETFHKIRDLRNIVSHRDPSHVNINSRIENKNMGVYQVQINNISEVEEWNTKDKLQEKCKEIVDDDLIKCKIWHPPNKPEKGVAYVDLCNQDAQDKLINIINNKKLKLNAKVARNKNTQNLYDFYQKSDYDLVSKDLKIFITEICKLLN